MNLNCFQGASESEHMGGSQGDHHVPPFIWRPLYLSQRDQYKNRPDTQIKVIKKRGARKRNIKVHK